MTLLEAHAIALAHGFVPEPQQPHFGCEMSHVSYLRRDWIYLILVSHEGSFLEGVWRTYLCAFNPKVPKGKDFTRKGERHSEHQKSGHVPILAGIARGTDLSTL